MQLLQNRVIYSSWCVDISCSTSQHCY